VSYPAITTTAHRRELVQTALKPTAISPTADGVLIDFGKAAFGTPFIQNRAIEALKEITVHLGEQRTQNGRVEREPEGTVRYRRIQQTIDHSRTATRLVIPPDERNTGEHAVLMPADIGEVLPFRYAEIEGVSKLGFGDVSQFVVNYPFDDGAASFSSDSKVLDDVWAMCKHTIKVTTFCGVYVDGDRERIPYEGDAWSSRNRRGSLVPAVRFM